MWRFIRQRDRYSCGPVSVVNAAKWAGLAYTERDLPYLRMVCKTTPKVGTGDQDLEEGLRRTLKLVATVQRGGRMTAEEALKFLQNPDHALVLMYQWKNWRAKEVEGHFIFAFGDGGNRIFCVNHPPNGPTVVDYSIRYFWKKWMLWGKSYAPRVWKIRLRPTGTGGRPKAPGRDRRGRRTRNPA